MYDKIKILKEKIKGAQILFKKIPKEKGILGIVLVLLIGFLLYQSFIAIQIKKLKAIDFQFTSQKKLIDFYNQIIKDANILNNELTEKENDFAQIRQGFVDEEELSNYFADFRALVKAYNLQVASLDFQPQENIIDSNREPLTYYQRLKFSVSLKGDYFNLMSLLYKLEQGSSRFEINSVRIKQKNADPPDLIMDMEAAIYILMKRG